MTPEVTQNYANHVRRLPLLYSLAALLLGMNVVWSLYWLVRNFSFGSVLGVLVAASLIVLFSYSRVFTLTVQDRLIRLEMHLRLERNLPDDLRPRIGEIGVKQLVALRFASDAELPALAQEVLAGRLTQPDAIKRAIKDWKADWLRA